MNDYGYYRDPYRGDDWQVSAYIDMYKESLKYKAKKTKTVSRKKAPTINKILLLV